jgi:hypothetical protein
MLPRLESTLPFSAVFFYREINGSLLIAQAVTNAQGAPTLKFFEGGSGNVESHESQHRSALLLQMRWGHPDTSSRLFEGSGDFLLIFASLRNRFIFFDR